MFLFTKKTNLYNCKVESFLIKYLLQIRINNLETNRAFLRMSKCYIKKTYNIFIFQFKILNKIIYIHIRDIHLSTHHPRK